ncbi:DNA-binding GntR family transcriptional regulator [Nocardiopsis mwathae]|uniref:DNA-binding GntR family transcriptional regulator n=1 Tax=Nocardiopsis mwathae TaxID=1472723 RepID=A0A7X0D5X8_9ACTN|nr:UTRA domain-containing protein [Nocardiopsis mwathae]MBB6172131.1 DNA-binding GntR family transcriptional regulator [Nocardiopsis mwathae]
MLQTRPSPAFGLRTYRKHPHTTDLAIHPGTQGLTVTQESAVDSVAHALDLEVGAPVIARTGVYWRANTPVQSLRTYFPTGVRRLGEPSRVTEEATVRLATPREQAELDLGALSPVMALRRIAYATTGRPVELTVCVLVPGYAAVYQLDV